MAITRSKWRLLLTAIVMWLAVEPLDVQCQVQNAVDDSAAISWLNSRVAKAVGEGKDSFLEDEYLRKSLLLRGHSPIGKRMTLVGQREIQVERFFWTVLAMRNRFIDEPQRRLQWDLLMTDVIVTGRVLSSSKEEKLCAYGTQVTIEVDRYLKGTGAGTIVIKLTRGRKISDRTLLLSSGEPHFEVGEEVLVQLSATPTRGHFQVTGNSTPDCLEFFYVTNTGGAYYEVAGIEDSKRTIIDGKLKWRGKNLTVDEVEASVSADLKSTF